MRPELEMRRALRQAGHGRDALEVRGDVGAEGSGGGAGGAAVCLHLIIAPLAHLMERRLQRELFHVEDPADADLDAPAAASASNARQLARHLLRSLRLGSQLRARRLVLLFPCVAGEAMRERFDGVKDIRPGQEEKLHFRHVEIEARLGIVGERRVRLGGMKRQDTRHHSLRKKRDGRVYPKVTAPTPQTVIIFY
jgi:hypothetical protein